MNKLSFVCLAGASLASAFFAGRWTAPQLSPTPEAVYQQPAEFSQAPTVPAPLPAQPIIQQPQIANLPDQPSYQRDWLQVQALLELAKTAPEAALEQTRQLKGELQQDAQNQILALWGQTNPALAWRWLESNQPQNNQAFIALIGAIAITQPTATLDFADRFAQSQSPIKKDIYQAGIQGLARGGHYDSAVFLLDYLDQNDGFRQDLTRALVEQWATYQPQSALEWLVQQPVQMTETPPGRAGVMPTETAQDDAQQQQNELLESTYRQWLTDDEIAAASWLGSQTPSPALDSLFSQLVEQQANNPAQALATAGRIQNTQRKLNSLLGLLSPIKQTDPSQASAYIDQLAYLNDSQRASLKRDLALTP